MFVELSDLQLPKELKCQNLFVSGSALHCPLTTHVALTSSTSPRCRSRQALADQLCLQMLRDLRGLASLHKQQQQQQHLQQKTQAPPRHSQGEQASPVRQTQAGVHPPAPQQQRQQRLPSLGIFKGGGYVAGDLEYMLQQTGLAPALRLQHTLEVRLPVCGALQCTTQKNAVPVSLQCEVVIWDSMLQ